LAGEVADGFMDHPIHGVHWITGEGQQALSEGLDAAGRTRSDIHWNAWLWVAVNDDRRQAIEDCRGTVAFYVGMRQYEPLFAAHGFGPQARACQEAAERKDMAAAAAAVTDEMVEHYVVVGTPDQCRERIATIWDVADSFCPADRRAHARAARVLPRRHRRDVLQLSHYWAARKLGVRSEPWE
jgi:alkanesulfonate monooxygenase SsuD/methylene tetrahydromethanopterin reductase-like flavin-dependent oxidoreductase (luciferase family)